MRVIAGTNKGRIIKAVPGKETRPTGDKVKEAIFHKLGPFFSGGVGLDLFAGSGSLGIEALSRGMDRMIFIDQSKQAIRTIQENTTKLELQEHCAIYRNDAFQALSVLQRKGEKFNLVLIDPPYDKINYKDLLTNLLQANIVLPNGKIYIELRTENNIELPQSEYTIVFERAYNQTTKTVIYEKK